MATSNRKLKIDPAPTPTPAAFLAQCVRVARRYAAWLRNMQIEPTWADYELCEARLADAGATGAEYEAAITAVTKALWPQETYGRGDCWRCRGLGWYERAGLDADANWIAVRKVCRCVAGGTDDAAEGATRR